MACGAAFEKYGWSPEGANAKVEAVSGGCVTSYSWEDAEARVKIRFPADLKAEPTSLEWTAWSVRLAFGTKAGGIFELRSLAAPITGAQIIQSKRNGAPILVLHKEKNVPWMHLAGPGVSREGQGRLHEDFEDAQSQSDSHPEDAFDEADLGSAVAGDSEEEPELDDEVGQAQDPEEEEPELEDEGAQAQDPEEEEPELEDEGAQARDPEENCDAVTVGERT
jgi:hypothetical protein